MRETCKKCTKFTNIPENMIFSIFYIYSILFSIFFLEIFEQEEVQEGSEEKRVQKLKNSIIVVVLHSVLSRGSALIVWFI